MPIFQKILLDENCQINELAKSCEKKDEAAWWG